MICLFVKYLTILKIDILPIFLAIMKNLSISNNTTMMEGKLKSKKATTATKVDPQQMLHWFVVSSYASGSFTEERVQNSVTLLQCVPAARYAVLHRFTLLFEEVIRAQLDQLEFQPSAAGISSELMASIELVVQTLLDLLHQNGEAWASILCTWSVESLGQISSCYKQRQIVPPPTNLPKVLMFWLNIRGMRMLLDIYRTSLKTLIEHNPESCVDSLLTASSNHSPYFDWVVADVGNAFPDAIIERVLYSGFTKFCKLRWTALGISSSSNITMNENEQSVLHSVIRILEHLMEHHHKLICSKMLDMFKFPSDKDTGRIKAAYFLMNIFTMSSSLLQATTLIFVREIDSDFLNSLYKEFQKLSRESEELEKLCSLAVHLVCKSNHGSYKLICLFVDVATSHSNTKLQKLDPAVKAVFSKILPSLLKDLHHLSLSKSYIDENPPSNALSELNLHYVDLCNNALTSSSPERKNWFRLLLPTMCFYRRASDIMSHILIESATSNDLEVFLKLYDDVHPLVPGIMEETIVESFQRIKYLSQLKRTNFLKNTFHLLSQTGSGLVSEQFTNRLKRSLCLVIDHLVDLLGKLSSPPELSAAAIQILFIIMSSVPRWKLHLTTRMIPLTRTIVFYFFRLLHSGHVNNDQAMQSCQRALVELSQTHELFQVVCRSVLEAAVAKDNRSLFGQHFESDFNEMNMDEQSCEDNIPLMTIHRKLTSQYSSRRTVGGFVPISVETGVIGGETKKKKRNTLSKANVSSNNESISLLIYRCCCKTSGGDDVSQLSIPDVAHAFDSDKLLLLSNCLLSAITSASPYLATAVTLDGELEWPACHMKKFTIERDLKVFHFLEEHPFVWQVLFLIAHNYKATWELSSIFRSCISVLLTHYETSRFASPPLESSLHYKFAIQVMQVMQKGQLIPPPLCHVSELFHYVTPYEVFVLLSAVWNFIKDHPPPLDAEQMSENERDFSLEKINQQPHMSIVHTIIHANIDKLGHLFSRFVLCT